jgi:hypothetical protein
LHAGNTQRETYNATDAFGLLLGMQLKAHIDCVERRLLAVVVVGGDVQPPAPGDICHQSIGPPHLQPGGSTAVPVRACGSARSQAGGRATKQRLHLPTYLPTEGILHHLLSPSGRISVGAGVCMKERESSSSDTVTVCR